uniref:Uncharacterized protein n=1 Tax=Physcomitrium patens TaxID=3218 RepID=A0A2K1IA44_PHYPA|nr:hypothetical protein PHYPA_030724 [Physcomitrium patens]
MVKARLPLQITRISGMHPTTRNSGLRTKFEHEVIASLFGSKP